MVSSISQFIAIGGNRNPGAADWDTSGSDILAFGAGRSVALWRPQRHDCRGIESLLSGHTDHVNAVKFLVINSPSKIFLLTGSADKSIRIWSSNDGFTNDFQSKEIPDAHKKSVNTIAVYPEASIFASGAADSELKIWRLNIASDTSTVEVTLLQTIPLVPRFIPLTIDFVSLPTAASIALAVAGTKATIQIYVSDQSKVEFQQATSLSGHEGWIRSLSFVEDVGSVSPDRILASASQDKYIRLWRISQGKTLPPTSESMTDPAIGTIAKSLSNKAYRFEANGDKFNVTFEALLVGHEDWIYTTRWDTQNKQLRLLSASADNSLAIWELEPISGVWVCTVRLGEISAQKGATTATGSSGGFWIGLWAPDGSSVVSLGRTGAWRKWNYKDSEDRWRQDVAVTGHTREVQGITWSKDGAYLLSTSSDQTTRLFAEWKRLDLATWHEFSRPQIHGYDLNCIDNIHEAQFITGADEKLLRVFDEPSAVADLLSQLAGHETKSGRKMLDTANIPVLGLSNKAVDSAEDNAANGNRQDDMNEIQQITERLTISSDQQPPAEDHLARHLLWPETEKLYGHGYEISTVAASHDGAVVATACRASSVDHAVIRVFETRTWQEIKPPLTAHSLTVTGLEFSPDDQYLLSVGRDRQCAVFKKDSNDRCKYGMLVSNSKAHSRMILGCSWAPDSLVFATAGRDRAVHCWKLSDNTFEKMASTNFPSPVTAISFLPRVIDNSFCLAAGFEDGEIIISTIKFADDFAFSMTANIYSPIQKPSLSISSLSWRPVQDDPKNSMQLAVASSDASLRIFQVDLME